MKAASLAILSLLASAGASHAQEDAPVGVPACDAFLAAYAACAASPQVPEAARSALSQSIGSMRQAWREAAGRDPRARAPLARQCLQTHEMTRPRLAEAFRCDFPAPDANAEAGIAAMAAAPAQPGVRPSGAAGEQADIAKANALVAVQNTMATFHPLAERLAAHQRANERVLRPGTRPGGNAWYSFGMTEVDSLVERLEAALALPGRAPELEPPAEALRRALAELAPVVKALQRYQSTREFNEDGFRFAREQEPVFVRLMQGAIRAGDGFDDAVFARETALDEKAAAAAPPGSLQRAVVGASLAAKRTTRVLRGGETRAMAAPLQASLADVAVANRELDAALGALNPKAAQACVSYGATLDAFLGRGRDLVRDLGRGSNPNMSMSGFIDEYNRSVDGLKRCRENEARARPG